MTENLLAEDQVVLPSDPARGPQAGNRVSRAFLLVLGRNRSMLVGGSILIMIALAVALAGMISQVSPTSIEVSQRLLPPGDAGVMGTDNFGRDIFSRVVHGGRLSLLVGLLVTVGSVTFGAAIGLLAGFFDAVDRVIMRVMDGMMAFPSLVLAVAMIGVLGAGLSTVVLALGFSCTPRVARVVRGSALVVRESPLVEAELALGARKSYVIVRHVLPSCLSPIIVQASFIFSYAVLGEAALSFLGVGVPADSPSWGNMLSDAKVYLQQAWWMSVFPGAAIVLTVLCLNIYGDGLRDALDPKMRRR